VLDCSPKADAPFPAEDGLYVYPVDTGTSHVYIATCLIQGNLAKPSSLSRCQLVHQNIAEPLDRVLGAGRILVRAAVRRFTDRQIELI
jgi:hypothetical protein